MVRLLHHEGRRRGDQEEYGGKVIGKVETPRLVVDLARQQRRHEATHTPGCKDQAVVSLRSS